MGNRSFIEVTSSDLPQPILLYGHWSGEDNLTAVRNVLARTSRIGDTSYLTAQLFWEFANLGNYDGELSYGISVGHIDENLDWVNSPTVYVNADNGTYNIDGVTYDHAGSVLTT